MPRKLHAEAAAGFGPRLAGLRKAAGISQMALAAEIGVSQRMMAYYESPTAHPPANLPRAPPPPSSWSGWNPKPQP